MSKLGERHTRRAEGVGHVIVLVGSSVLRVKWTAYGIRPAHLHVCCCEATGQKDAKDGVEVHGCSCKLVIHDGCSCVCVMVN